MASLNNTGNQGFFQFGTDQSPQSFLDTKALQHQLELNNKEFALLMDSKDPLAYVRQKFCYPKMETLPNGLFHVDEK